MTHILIPAIAPAISYDLRTTSSSVLTFPFPFFAAPDLVVKFNGIVKLLDVHYTVVGTGGFTAGFPGGFVVFPAPVHGVVVVISRHIEVERTVDFPASGPLQTDSLNTQLDKIVAMIQDTNGEIVLLDARIDVLELGDPRLGRALLFPAEDLALNHVLPAVADRAQRTLGFDASGQIQMRSAITVPDAPRDLPLPNAANRVNRVIGFDVTGVNINMNQVVAGTLVPNSANLEYLAFASATARSVENRLRERISIKDFGPNVGTGDQVADDTALAAAIAYFNTLPQPFNSLYYPAGIYFHGPCATAITRGNLAIIGDSDVSTQIIIAGTTDTAPWLKIGVAGGTRVDNVLIASLALQNTVNTSTLFQLTNTFGVVMRDLALRDVATFAIFGASGATNKATNTYLRDVTGNSNNKGRTFFRLLNCQGVFCSNLTLWVPIPVPINTHTTANGTLLFNASAAQVQGVRVDNSHFSYFDIGLSAVNTTAGTFLIDFDISATTFLLCKNGGIVLQAQTGGTVQSVHAHNCWFGTFNLDAVFLGTGAGGSNDYHRFSDCVFAEAGRCCIYLATVAHDVIIANNQLIACNRQGSALGAIYLNQGGGYQIVGNVGEGIQRAAPWGIYVEAGVDNYQISENRVTGASGPIFAVADGINTPSRRIMNNSYTQAPGGYAAIFLGESLDGNGSWFNTSPYTVDFYITLGDVETVYIQDTETPGGYAGPWRVYELQPGEHIQIIYNVLPNTWIRRHG